MPVPPASPFVQDPAAAAAPAAEGSFGSALWAWCSAPGTVELLLAVGAIGTALLLWWRLARLCAGARDRQALRDYLLGVEQALHGDLPGARERLQSVLQQDPQNHYARLLLGKVLAELGEPAQAHTQHLYLQRAFGVDSAENELLLAHSLLGAGMASEAADAAERALARAPDRLAAREFVYRARLQAGDFDAAARAGRALLEGLRDGPRARQLRGDVAATLAQAGLLRLQRGDGDAAGAALQAARRLAADAAGVPLLGSRLQAHQHGVPTAVQALLRDAPVDAASPQLPVPVGGGPLVAAAGLPSTTLAGLVPAERRACRACGGALASPVVECPRCGSRAGADLHEPALVAAVGSPTHTMDAVDENDAHVQRLVRVALDEPDGPASAAARDQVLALRERAVEELLRQAWHRGDEPREAAVALLRAMGPTIAPALFAASDALEQQRLLPIGARSPAALVGRIVQGFDRRALPHVESLFASARPEHRKILIDFFLGLADLGEFQLVLERFPPTEILHRFNKADGEVLRRFLQAVPPGHFVAESLLLEPTFYREDEVLAAIPGAAHPEVLERALLRRGPTRTATKALIAAIGAPELAATAARLLQGLGEAVLDHVLAAFVDLERAGAERELLGGVLCRAGAPAVERLCSSFGPEPMAQDDVVRGVLAAMGDVAVAPLQAAYGLPGWLERVSSVFVSRHTNRRVQIVRTLHTIGSPAAVAALLALREAERDQNLKLRLQQALHDLPGAAPGETAEEDRRGLG
jgi:hypothetical protein